MFALSSFQALGMLFWHKHNIEKSLADLPNFTPFPDEWTVEDKVLFEQGFSFHGKTFHRIQQMVSTQASNNHKHEISSSWVLILIYPSTESQ